MKASESKIKKYIGGPDQIFTIPPFQRNYAWTKKNCQELWEDIENSFKNNLKHYLGNIIYYEADSSGMHTEYILVDGQQRITTIFLLLIALRDTNSDEEFVKDLQNKFLINDTKETKNRLKLKSTNQDYAVFKEIMNKDIKNYSDSKSKLVENYEFFKDKIEKTDLTHEEILKTLMECEIVTIDLEKNSLEAIQTIYEQINSTGEALTVADLIRNLLLFSNDSSEQEKLYNEYWVPIENRLGTENISDFITSYLIINTDKKITIKNRYLEFKEYCRKKENKNKEILEDLSNYSKFYAYIVNEDCQNSIINRKIKEIKQLKVNDLYPLITILLKQMYKNETEELIKIMKMLADFILRYRIVKDYSGGGALQTVVKQLINKIKSENTITETAIRRELSNTSTRDSEYPTDARFAEILKTKSFKTDIEAVLLISRIEKYLTNKDIDVENYRLDNVMPQDIEDWDKNFKLTSDKLTEFHSENLKKLSNLVLVSEEKWDSEIENYSFFQKRILYNTENLETTRKIYDDYSIWNEESIEKRLNDMINLAVEATISPLPRTKGYKGSYTPGEYVINEDIETTGAKLEYIKYNGVKEEMKNWSDLFAFILKKAYEYNGDKFKKIMNSDIKKESSENKKLIQVGETDIYMVGASDSKTNLKNCNLIIDKIGLDPENFIIKLK